MRTPKSASERPTTRPSLFAAGEWRSAGRLAVAAVIAGLLYAAFRQAPLSAILAVLRHLRPWQVPVVLAVDSMIFVLISARWWIVARSTNPEVEFWPMLRSRLAAFGVSYLTLGPQIGGEPIQLLLLRRRYGLTYARAVSTVIMDKLLELLANFVFLMLGLRAVMLGGLPVLSSPVARAALIGLAALAAWPLVHVILLRKGYHPLSAIVSRVPKPLRQSRLGRTIRLAEHLAGRFSQRHTNSLLAAIMASLAALGLAVLEYSLITFFIGIELPLHQTVAAWSAAWLSFLVPLPGGLGALEASQVLALGYFGIGSAAAISVALIIRGRDLVFCGIGLLAAPIAAIWSNPRARGQA